MTASDVDESKAPYLVRGCRLSKDNVLLMPEGILKLSASALRILALCDGQRSVAQIVGILQAEYAPAVHQKIRDDVVTYLAKLLDKKAVELK